MQTQPEATFNPFRIFDRVVARKFLLRQRDYEKYEKKQLEEMVPHNLRLYHIDGETWFLAKDVCSFLGISLQHVSYYMKKIEPQYVRQEDVTLKISGPETWATRTAQTSQTHKLYLVNEYGVYALIQKAKTVYAKEFQAWLNEEVLPTIRKTGSYTAPPRIEDERVVIHDNLEFEKEAAEATPKEEIEEEFREIVKVQEKLLQEKEVVIESQKVTIEQQHRVIELKTSEHIELMNSIATLSSNIQKMQESNQKTQAKYMKKVNKLQEQNRSNIEILLEENKKTREEGRRNIEKVQEENRKNTEKLHREVSTLSTSMKKMQDKLDTVVRDRVAKPEDENSLGVLSIFYTEEEDLTDPQNMRYPYVICKCQRNTLKQNEKRITDKYTDAKKIFSINNPSADTLFKALRERIKQRELGVVIKNTSFYFCDDELTIEDIIRIINELERERTNV